MCIKTDMPELLRRADSMIRRFEKGHFIEGGDIVSLAFLQMTDEGKEYEKGIFAKIMFNQVRTAYRKTLAISHPINLDGAIYARFAKTRICSCCKEELGVSAYNVYYNATYEGWFMAYECKVCAAARSKEWDIKNPDKLAARQERNNISRQQKRAKEKQQLTDSYMIKKLVKKYPLDWIKQHPEIIDKERRILRYKLKQVA